MSAAQNRTSLHSLIPGLAICVCASLLAFALCACTPRDTPPVDTDDIKPVSLETSDSYEELLKTLQEKQDTSTSRSSYGLMLEDSAVFNEGAATDESKSASGTSDYSSTNIQVAGIDEGDRVKTDGTFIFSISNGDIVITQADGEQSRVRSRFFLNDGRLHLGSSMQNEVSETSTPNELFISGNTLAVLYDDGYLVDYYSGDAPKPRTFVALVDISNPDEPVLSALFGQDGNLDASRLSNGKLILVSSFWLYNTKPLDGIDESTYQDFVPTFYEGEASQAADVNRMFIAPDCCDYSFTVVSTIDLEEKKRVDNASLAGRCDNLYMSPDTLYLASTSYDSTESDAYRKGKYSVVDCEWKNMTHVSAFSFDDGVINPVGSVGFDGELLNQFSLDEYDGNLRVATTVDKYSHRILTDKFGDVEKREHDDEITHNSLLVFDKELNLMSTIENLAPDESIYSVRFDGPVGYVVTYKQVDPLFTIDLSDPYKPFVASALKIPGFSRYLHLYSENRLFGLGQSTEVSLFGSERVDGLKLSMFDITNPFDVTEKNMLVLEDSYSEALYDHHAIFVSAENDLIGFSVYGDYLLYGYSDEKGFYERASIDEGLLYEYDLPDSSGGDSSVVRLGAQPRALYVADSLYVVGENGMCVLELSTLAEEARVSFIAS